MNFEQQHQEQVAKTIFVVVPCSGYEKLCLYQEEVQQRGRRYEQGNPGMTIEYGRLGGEVLSATIWFDRFDGRMVAFVEPGWVMHLGMLEDHLGRMFSHVPKWDQGVRAPISNPMNFHLCLAAIDELNARVVTSSAEPEDR